MCAVCAHAPSTPAASPLRSSASAKVAPHSAASCAGVRPCASRALRSAPAESSAATASESSHAAKCKAEAPSSSTACASAPAASNAAAAAAPHAPAPSA
eukprot:562939-Pleurochrysis_carterae.AAC.1